MVSKCANPSCSTPLIYLREGKLFIMEHVPEPKVKQQTGPKSKKPSNVEHFWLCGPCSAQMTLTYDRKTGVRVLPKQVITGAA
jgi:hypothetical protein